MNKTEIDEVQLLRKEVGKLKNKIIRDEKKVLMGQIESQKALLEDFTSINSATQRSLSRSKSISQVMMLGLVVCITAASVSGFDSFMGAVESINMARDYGTVEDVIPASTQTETALIIPETTGIWDPRDEIADEELANSILEALDDREEEEKKVSRAELRGFGDNIDPERMLAALESGDNDRINRAMLNLPEED